VAALARLTAPGLAAARINADLTARGAAAAKSGADCNTDPPRSFHERFITVTFVGPSEVAWRALFPVGFLAENSQPWTDSAKVSPTLVALYFAHAPAMDAECRAELVRLPTSFRVWLDAA
jgi:hypothetical protein